MGVIGAVELLVTWTVYRKMSRKQPVKINAKMIGKVIYGVIALSDSYVCRIEKQWWKIKNRNSRIWD